MKVNIFKKCAAIALASATLLSPINAYALIEPTGPAIPSTALSFNTTIDTKGVYPRYEQYHELSSGDYEIKATAIVHNKGVSNSGLKLIVACADKCRVNGRTVNANETIAELAYRDIGRYSTYNKRFTVASTTREGKIKVFVRVMGLEGAAGEITNISLKSCRATARACEGNEIIRNGDFRNIMQSPLKKNYPADWNVTAHRDQAGVNLTFNDGKQNRSVLAMNSLADQDVRASMDLNLKANSQYLLWTVAKASFADNDSVTIKLICNDQYGCTYTGAGKTGKPAKVKKGETLSQISFNRKSHRLSTSSGFNKHIADNGSIYLTADAKAVLEIKAENGGEMLVDSIRLTERDTRHNPEPVRNRDFDHSYTENIYKMQPTQWDAGSGNWGYYTGQVIERAINY